MVGRIHDAAVDLDNAAIDEVMFLLGEIKSAWDEIRPVALAEVQSEPLRVGA